MAGVCAECGLAFEWAELLSSKIRKPTWNVEYARSVKSFPVVALATLLMSFAPGRFFSSLKMTHEFRPRRIMAYLLSPLIVLYLSFALSQGLTTRSQINGIMQNSNSTISIHPGWVIAQAVLLPLSPRSLGTYTFLAGGNATFYTFQANVVKVNPATGAVTMNLTSPFERAARKYRFHINYSYWEVWPEVLFGTRGMGGWGMHWKLVLLCLMLVTIHSLLCAVGFVLLPQSRRQCRVKWSHIVRITMYGLAFIMFMIVGLAMMVIFRRDQYGLYQGVTPIMRLTSLVLIPGMLVVWWSYATQRYLKIPHGWAVGVSLSLIAYLLGPVLIFCMAIFVI